MEIGDSHVASPRLFPSLSLSLSLSFSLSLCLSLSCRLPLPRTLCPSCLHQIHFTRTKYTYVYTHTYQVSAMFSLALCTILRFFLLLVPVLLLSRSFLSRQATIRVFRSENSSVGPGQESLMNLRLEVISGLESGRYWLQLTLKYHRCGSVRDDGTRCVSGGAAPSSLSRRVGNRNLRPKDQGPKNWSTLWTFKLADPRESIRASREIEAVQNFSTEAIHQFIILTSF